MCGRPPFRKGFCNIFLARSRSGHVSGLLLRPIDVPLASMEYVSRSPIIPARFSAR